MVLALIELGQGSSGSEPWSPWVTHLPPAALLGKARIGLPPLHLSPSFYSSTKILMALKSMLPLLGPNGTSWPWPMQRIPSGRACWPVGILRFDYEEGQRCFSSLSHKGGLVLRQDNGTSKRHVKLTPTLCNNSNLWFDKCFCAFLHICKYLHLSQRLPLFRRGQPRRWKTEEMEIILMEKGAKQLDMLEGKCWAYR